MGRNAFLSHIYILTFLHFNILSREESGARGMSAPCGQGLGARGHIFIDPFIGAKSATMRKLILIKCRSRYRCSKSCPHKDKLAKLFWSLILAFEIGSNLVALDLPPLSLKKSHINLWYLKQDRELNSRIRLLFKIQGLSNCMKSIVMQYGVSCIQSSFSLMMADGNNWQTQLFSVGPILNTNLYTLGFGLSCCPLIKLNKLSLERICDPLTIMIRALFVST